MSTASGRRRGSSKARRVFYPYSDGKPLGETRFHVENCLFVMFMLEQWLEPRYPTFVTSNMFVYWAEGNPRRHVSPDVLVALGRPPDSLKKNWKTWDDGPLDLVIEFTSASTRKEDQVKKFRIYQDELKVPEYFLFDPLSEYLTPRLQGYTLRRGVYTPIRENAGRFSSEVLGLHLFAGRNMLRLIDPQSKHELLPPMEGYRALRTEAANAQAHSRASEAARQQSEAARQQSEAARRQSEANLQRIKAENKRLRSELESLRRRKKRRRSP
jgi:Uma2 family endonuclease